MSKHLAAFAKSLTTVFGIEDFDKNKYYLVVQTFSIPSIDAKWETCWKSEFWFLLLLSLHAYSGLELIAVFLRLCVGTNASISLQVSVLVDRKLLTSTRVRYAAIMMIVSMSLEMWFAMARNKVKLNRVEVSALRLTPLVRFYLAMMVNNVWMP